MPSYHDIFKQTNVYHKLSLEYPEPFDIWRCDRSMAGREDGGLQFLQLTWAVSHRSHCNVAAFSKYLQKRLHHLSCLNDARRTALPTRSRLTSVSAIAHRWGWEDVRGWRLSENLCSSLHPVLPPEWNVAIFPQTIFTAHTLGFLNYQNNESNIYHLCPLFQTWRSRLSEGMRKKLTHGLLLTVVAIS